MFLPPRYFQQEADTLKCGALATPVGFDWDGDGDTDILSGNTAGYIEFFENLERPGRRAAEVGRAAAAGGGRQVFRIMAGPNGSIQGPAEAKWGYTTLNVADWDARRPARHRLQLDLGRGRVAAERRHAHRAAAGGAAADRGRVGRRRRRSPPGPGGSRKGKELVDAVADDAGGLRLQRRRAARPGDARPRGLSGPVRAGEARRRTDAAAAAAGVRRRAGSAAAAERQHGRRQRAAQAVRRPTGTATGISTFCSIRPTPTSAAGRTSSDGKWVFQKRRHAGRRPNIEGHDVSPAVGRLRRRRRSRLPRRRGGRLAFISFAIRARRRL